ncbi:hypothetical protein ILYODFUR_026490 [Ilyodon furcidens]|uniref:Uncharacterized protein n=1 Tax=Ilyodon furcidens TaxID=33524 RepID=A0ABV0V885_9TELE
MAIEEKKQCILKEKEEELNKEKEELERKLQAKYQNELLKDYVKAALHHPTLSAPASRAWLCSACCLHVRRLEPDGTPQCVVRPGS